MRVAPVDPVTTQVDLDWVADHIDDDTVALVGSACNYGYGTVDPIAGARPARARRAASGCTSTAASAASSCRSVASSATTSTPFDFSVPGRDHDLGGHPQVRLRPQGHERAVLRRQGAAQRAVLLPDRLVRRQVLLAGHGRLALGRAARGDVGGDGQPRPRGLPPLRRGRSSRRPRRCRTRSRRTTRCASSGRPSFLFSFTSDDFDVYHVNDFLRTRGWRLNGQQYPNALHMDVTRPQTQPGVVERWATDLADAVAYARGARERARQVLGASTVASPAG